MRRPFIQLAAVMLLPAQAWAQLGPATMVPPPASRRILDWATTFPITPAFGDWTRIGALVEGGTTVGEFYLHRDSLRWADSGSGPILHADVLAYTDGQNGRRQGWQRSIKVLSCDAHAVAATKAVVDVAISAGGAITPTSVVAEGDHNVTYVDRSGSMYEALCFNAAIQNDFRARN